MRVWHLDHNLLPPSPQAHHDRNTTQSECSQEYKASSSPSSQFKAMISPWEGLPPFLILLTSVLQKLWSSQLHSYSPIPLMEWKLKPRQSSPRMIGLVHVASSMEGKAGHKDRKLHSPSQENWLYLEWSVGKFKSKGTQKQWRFLFWEMKRTLIAQWEQQTSP